MRSNAIQLRLDAQGMLTDSSGNSGVRSINGMSFADRIGVWMSAVDSAGNIRIACHDMIGGSNEFKPGPLFLSNAQASDTNVWNKVYPMTQALVAEHKENYNSDSYTPPMAISNWPGSGSAGLAKVLAPFVDVEVNDQIYNPADGDYPFLRTSQEMLAISNDMAAPHSLSGALPLGVELHAEVIGFGAKDTSLRNCILIRYSVFNRSKINYSNFRFSTVVNFAIGQMENEYLGTDVANNVLFAINDTGEATFSNKLVSIGCMALNHRLSSTMYFENTIDPVNGLPVLDSHYLRLMKGIWKNGKRLVYGGNGVDASGNTTSFVYPYDTDMSQGGQMWSDNDRYQPGKRYGLLNFDSIELKAGMARTYEVAVFIVEEDSFNIKQITNNCLTIKQSLRGMNLMKNTQNGHNLVEKMSIYPNPVKVGEKLRIDTNEEMPLSMRVISSDGREIMKVDLHDFDNYIILPVDFSDGIYFLEYQTLNTRQYIKFVVNH